MKTLLSIVTVGLIVLTSCTAQFQARNYDDVYYSAKDQQSGENTYKVKPTKVETEAIQAPSGENAAGYYTDEEMAAAMPESDSTEYAVSDNSTYVSNYYGYDRDNYNMYYDPWDWRFSLSFGYPWGYPSMYSYSYWNWPYYRWSYYDWYYPYSYYGYGYNSYYSGYWNGFYDGYYYSYYDSYYPYYASNNNYYYYGHRRGVGGSGGLRNGSRLNPSGDRRENLLAQANSTRTGSNEALSSVRRTSDGSSNSGLRSSTATTEGVTLRNSVRNMATGNVQPGRRSTQSDVTQTGTALSGTRSAGLQKQENPGRNAQVTPNRTSTSQEPKTSTRYTYQGTRSQPGSQSVRKSGTIQPYSSPSYNKPRSSQEYTAPKYRNTMPSTEKNSQGGNVQTPSQQERKTYSVPSRSNTQQQPGTNPSRSTYSAPKRTGEYRSTTPNSNQGRSTEYRSTPQNNNSYSQPSRSGSSYSAPARSSGSSSSGSSTRSSGNSSSSPSRSSSSGSGHRR